MGGAGGGKGKKGWKGKADKGKGGALGGIGMERAKGDNGKADQDSPHMVPNGGVPLGGLDGRGCGDNSALGLLLQQLAAQEHLPRHEHGESGIDVALIKKKETPNALDVRIYEE